MHKSGVASGVDINHASYYKFNSMIEENLSLSHSLGKYVPIVEAYNTDVEGIPCTLGR